MPVVRFTRNIQRHVECPEREIEGTTVREVLETYFASHPGARGYVLDDRSCLRQHMAVFVDGNQVSDRDTLSDPVPPTAILDIVQALSGGNK
jgi:hypothetical protein